MKITLFKFLTRSLWLSVLLVSLSVGGVLASDPEPEPRAQVFYIPKVVTVAQRNAITQTGALIVEAGHDYVLVEALPSEVAALRALGLDAQTPPSEFLAPQDFPGADSAFHNYDEMVAALQQTAAAHPAIFSLFSLGQSEQGREIWAGKISDNVGADEAEPEVLLTHHQHAREHLTVEMALYTLKTLTSEYGIDPTITHLVDSREIWIVFDMNPDGGEYDIATGSYRSWRKNRQPNDNTPAIGTDLNRNWGYKFGCCGGSSNNPASETYRGASAFSAPETRRVRDFVNSRVVNGAQQITTAIDFHTYSELVLWPYGYTMTDVPSDMTQDDWDVLVTMGKAMAKTNNYTPEQASDLYITDGTIDDWLYGVHKIFNYTFEMYPTSSAFGGFYPPDDVIPQETARNRQALLYLLEYANCPFRAIGKENQYCGLTTTNLYDEKFEGAVTWTINADGTDTATRGAWQIGKPRPTYAGGAKQVGKADSDRKALVTGRKAGARATDFDVDGGVTTARSGAIALDNAYSEITLSFAAYMAHGNNSNRRDYFRVRVIGDTTQTLYEERGNKQNDNANWLPYTFDLTAFKGQTIRLQVECADMGKESLVECGVDSIRFEGIQ